MKITPISFTRISKTIQIPNQNINKISFVQKADSVHFGNIKKEETQQKIIILAGAPNSGKGTTAGILSKKYNIPAATASMAPNWRMGRSSARKKASARRIRNASALNMIPASGSR